MRIPNLKIKLTKSFFRQILLLNLILAFVVFGQKDGQDYYNKAMKAKTTSQRISLLSQAVTVDPSMTKAYVALGKALKQQGDLEEAEKYLQRSLIANPAELNKNLRFEIISDIGVIQRALGDLSRANDSFLAARQLTNDSKLLAEIFLNLGELNLDMEKIDKALSFFLEGNKLAPNDSRFASRIEQLRDEKKLYEAYSEGNKHFSFQRYPEAIAAYQSVLDLNPDFKDTREKMAEVQKKQDEQSRLSSRNKSEQGYVKGIDYLEKNQLVNENDLIKDSGVAESLRPETPKPAAGRKEPSDPELEAGYQRGVQYLGLKQWSAAIQEFEKVDALAPEYQEVGRYLTQARNALQEDQMGATKQRLYEAAQSAMAQEDWNAAMAALDQLLSIEPGYKDAVSLLKQAQTEMDGSLMDDWQNNYYEKGIQFMEQENWLEARIAFEKVVVVDSNYKNVQNLLEETKARLNSKVTRTGLAESAGSGWRTVFIILIGTAVFLVSAVVLILVIQPRILGEYYFKKQQLNKASAVFEKIWRKNAGDPENNVRLAEIYFRQKREDIQSIRVYESVILNDLETPVKSEISTIVAYYYLSNGNADTEKIEILEKVMNREINKIKATRGR